MGSTEWGEDFAEWIREHVVAYINLGMFPPSLTWWLVSLLSTQTPPRLDHA